MPMKERLKAWDCWQEKKEKFMFGCKQRKAYYWLICHAAETYPLMKDLWIGTHFNFTHIEIRNKSTCRLQTGSHVPLLYHPMKLGFLQGSLWVTNYSLKWKCSYSLMKLTAHIKHKSHSFLFCPLNLDSVWVPGFCVLSKHANMFLLFAVWNMRTLSTEFFHCLF